MTTHAIITECIKALTAELHKRNVDPVLANEVLMGLTKLQIQLENGQQKVN